MSWTGPGWPEGSEHAVRRHRAPTDPTDTLAGVGSRLGAAALIVAAIALGGLIVSRTPDTDVRERPFIRTGAIGEPVDARTFDATVIGARGATQVSRSQKLHDTTGLWVLVRVRALAHDEPTRIGYAALVDRHGRTFEASTRIDQPLVKVRTLQPGIPVEGEIAFEVPRDAADGAAVHLSPAGLGTRMEAIAEVPLRVDDATVEQWLNQPALAVVTDAGAAG
jgi:hypothetical protein